MQFGSYDVVPSMFVETDLVKGGLTARLAASAICDSLLDPPEVCEVIEQRLNAETQNKVALPGGLEVDEDVVPLGILVLGILVMVALVFSVVGYAAYLYIGRTVYQDAVSDVDAIVTGYQNVGDASRRSTQLSTVEPVDL